MIDGKAIPGLVDRDLFRQANLVGGQWIQSASGARIMVEDPATGAVLGAVPSLSREQVAEAIATAAAAQHSWSSLTVKARATILKRLFDLMMENQDDLARIMTAEQGKPFAEAKGEVAYAASYFEWFAEEGKRVYGDTIPEHLPGRRLIVRKEPVGVFAAITPWNFPAAMVTRKAGPGWAAGCTGVIRPSELTPFSALAIGVLAERAGMPPGVCNIITGDPAETGREFCANETVRKLSFTGSTRVGSLLLAQCAASVKKTSMELGGNAPFIVFNDADLDAAVEGAMASKFRNTGQTCVCANRFYIQDAVYDAFAEKLVAAVGKLKVGNGFDDETTQGPLISEAAVRKVGSHIADATAKGARIVAGGRRHVLGRTFFEPTVLCDVGPECMVCHEETFGPVAALVRFDSEDEAIALANASSFGLAAYFYSSNMGRIFRVGEALEAGIIGINEGLISNEAAPFGGVKLSGLGREGSKYGIEDYLELKYLCIGGIG